MVPSVACFENFRWSKLTAHSLRLNALHDRCQFGVKQAALTDLLDVLAQVLQKWSATCRQSATATQKNLMSDSDK
jgi:hypothetical protein